MDLPKKERNSPKTRVLKHHLPLPSRALGHSQHQNKAAAPIWGKINIRKWNLNQEPVNSEGFGLGFNHLSFKFGVNQIWAELVLFNQHCMALPGVEVHWNSCSLREKPGVCSQVRGASWSGCHTLPSPQLQPRSGILENQGKQHWNQTIPGVPEIWI